MSGATANEQLDYTPKIDSFRKIGEQIDITALYNQEPEISPSIDSLIAVSVKLRDIARYLGVSSSATINLADDPSLAPGTSCDNRARLTITDVQDGRGEWVSLGVGQSLKLVSRMIHSADSSQETQDFLAFDCQTSIYHPLIKFPLSRYCYALFERYFR